MSMNLINQLQDAVGVSEHPGALDTLKEIRRRRVFRAAVAYGVVAWIVLQVAEVTFEPLQLPGWTMTALVIAAILGFPLVLVLAWVYDLSVHGVVRTGDSPSSGYNQRLVAIVISLIVAAAVAAAGLSLYNFYARSGVPVTSSSASITNPRSVAVLPFADFSASRDQAYFGDGIAEELLNVLSQVPGLRVAARTSSFAYRDSKKSVGDIARDLGVAHVVEGSVRTAGDRIRITAQLINAESGFHLWSETFDRKLDDIFAIQDDIAKAIANAMLNAVGSGNAQAAEVAIDQGHAQNLQAYEPYLQGLELLHQRTQDSLQKAIQFFDAAVAADPEFAKAYAALSKSWLLSTIYGNAKLGDAVAHAQAAANHAIILAPRIADGHAAHGLIRMQVGQMLAAEKALKRAIELNPNDAMAHSWLGNVYLFSNRPEESFKQHKLAFSLDPKHPVTAAALSEDYLQRGRYDEAIAILKKALTGNQGDSLLLQTMARAAVNYGHLDDAVLWAHRANDIDPNAPLGHALLAEIYLNLGMINAAARRVATALRIAPDNMQLFRVSVMLELMRGDGDGALRMVQRILDSAEAQNLPANYRKELFTMAAFVAHRLGHNQAVLTWMAGIEAETEENGGMNKNSVDAKLMRADALVRLGRDAQAQEILDGLRPGMEKFAYAKVRPPERGYLYAVYLALTGQPKAAVANLQESVTSGYSDYWMIQTDQRLDSIRDDAGYKQSLEMLGQRLSRVSDAVAEAG